MIKKDDIVEPVSSLQILQQHVLISFWSSCQQGISATNLAFTLQDNSELKMQIDQLKKTREEEKQQHDVELKEKDSEVKRLQDEFVISKQSEEELSRWLDTVSLSGLSLDSGFYSDTQSLASWTSRSTAASTLSLDTLGATGARGKSKGLFKKLVKKLQRAKVPEQVVQASVPVAEQAVQASVPVAEQAVQASVPAIYFTEDGAAYLTYETMRDPKLLLTVSEKTVYLSDDGPVYLLTDQHKGNPILLLCGQHKMDREHVNAKYCHVTADGRLVNTSPPSHIQEESRSFKKYWGTFGTSPIHLPHSPSSLTPVPPAPQYWETETAVGVERGVYRWCPVIEIGVLEEDKMDSDWKRDSRSRSWCVKVGRCYTHKGVCTQVWNQGNHVECVRDTMSNSPGASYTLRYGVVVDIVRGRVGFIDVNKGVVLLKMDVEFNQTIYPVFGVCRYPDDFTVEMRLITGSDVTMTEDKQKLIYSCLT